MNPAQTALKTKLEKLECHFTWGLEVSRYQLLLLRDHLEDIGSDQSFPWLGQMYNLWAYIHHTLGSTDAALQCLSKAEEAFYLNSPSDKMGPWLLVHYGNLAWVHYHLDNQAESQRCVTKVEGLLRDYPSPSQEELHPEVCAEKAWTLMKFDQDKRLKAIDYFQMAIRMEPERKEWQSSHALALDSVYPFHPDNQQKESEVLKELRLAKEHDPDNLYVASIYLLRLGRTGQVRSEEAQQLAQHILKKPVSCYSGLSPLIQFYRTYLSHNEAIDLADEALERHPNDRYLKKHLANSYKWKIYSKEDSLRRQSMYDRAISLYKDVISLYPETSLKVKLELASIYAESDIDRRELAKQIYEELLASEQDPHNLQLLYFNYARYLNFHIQDRNASIDFHMKAAEIPNPNKYVSKKFPVPTLVLTSPAQTALKTKLEKLECHFTWGLEVSRYQLLLLRDHLEDIGSDQSFPWLGQMYNLWAYIHHTLGSTDAALQCLSMAEEAFYLNSPSDKMGPWLLVHYGNLAWVHYHLDNQAESQRCVTKVEGLLRDYPLPSQEELHPENNQQKESEVLKELRLAKEHDPDNLYVASIYLLRLGMTGQVTEVRKRNS
ncbi:hypothetical protein J4Q44_G00152350 [Coregonus suidteri]|uniref:Uncharacterized protein n=1 Tax=Coregonus suidteri TaxID=861788 RepID=A0AAN8QW86_9TELE